MKAPRFLLGLPAILLALAVQGAAQGLRVGSLKCEYRVEPLGIDTVQPRLSWRLESTERGERQTAFQILAATTPDRLSEKGSDLWDTGKQSSDQTIHVGYAGKRLRSRMQVFWKVRVWDQEGRPTAWSAPSHWQMGLLNESDWEAAWVGHPAAVAPTVAFRNGYHCTITDRPDTNKWVQLDLGEKVRFDAVRLFPARPFNLERDTPGFLFPLRFRIEASDTADFRSPKILVDATAEDVPNPETNVWVGRFRAVSAQYVRLYVTQLRSRKPKEFGFALAEMQVLRGNRNLARTARVISQDSIEDLGWLKEFLVDGDVVSHGGTKPAAQPVTVMRKEFLLTEPPRRAIAYVSALGLYELRLNGRRAGDHVLPPEWTDYPTRVQYQVYDVTPLLRPGPNVLGALLGDGWYAGRLGMSDRLYGVLRGVYGPKPYLLVQLELELANGNRLRVCSDGSWRTSKEGPWRSSDLIDGETYDARREMAGWDLPEFRENCWLPAEVRKGPAVRLVAQPNEPIRLLRDLQPVALNEPKPGVFVFDLGQNMAGRSRVLLEGEAGATITLRHAEMTNEDGTIYTANLRRAPQIDRYVCRGGGTEVYEPVFTQHGFRYVEVTGVKRKLNLSALQGRGFNSDAPEVGRFECSDPQLNRLWTNILWTQRANLMCVPTDCPQRDERLGWTGDIQAFAQTAIFNMDLAAFFTKWTRDLRDKQGADGRYPDFAPHPGNTAASFAGVPAWGDAGVIVPWRAYQNYADARLLGDHFDSARRWIDYIHSYNRDLIWRHARNNNYNDWLNGDTIKQKGWPTNGAAVPKEVFATAFFAHSTELVAKMAGLLGRTNDARRYGALHDDIKAAFNREFVSTDGRVKGDTQAGYALALNFNLLPEHLRRQAAEHMVEGLRRYSNHISTGIQTTHRLMLELSRWGCADSAWQLLTNRTFPSWGYMLENGATTIWERWDGYVNGRGFQDPEMNSLNHWALGAVGEWMWRHIGGISPDETRPGYKHFTIAPLPGGGVTWAKCQYDSIRGLIASEWRLGDGIFHLHATIPPNTTATIHVPCPSADGVLENGKPISATPEIKLLRREADRAVLLVSPGRYQFRSQ